MSIAISIRTNIRMGDLARGAGMELRTKSSLVDRRIVVFPPEPVRCKEGEQGKTNRLLRGWKSGVSGGPTKPNEMDARLVVTPFRTSRFRHRFR